MGKYTVKSGDGWYRISQQTGVSEADLKKFNPEIAQKGLDPGDEIKTSGGLFSTVKNWFSSNNQEDTPQHNVKPGAYYVNYADQNITTGIGDGKQRLGHAGVLLVDDSGKKSYYEYGRYPGGIGAVLPQKAGNWQTRNVSGNTLDEVSESLLSGVDASNIRLTHVPADISKIRKYIMSEANNPNRDHYNIPGVSGSCNLNDKSCGSEASDAISKGWSASPIGKAIRWLGGTAAHIFESSNPGAIVRDAVNGLFRGGEGATMFGPLNYTSQEYEDKWNNRGYSTHTYRRK